MADKIATRNAYGEALAELGEKYPQLVVLDADLSGATMSKFFAAKFPDRFFDCGIAEANMTGIAAGLATCGLKPFTNTFAIFTAGRAYEQVRNSIAYPGLNVCCPCDGNEMRQAVEALINYDGPAYLRLERPSTEIVTDSVEGYRFELGKGVTMKDGGDVTIIANGIMVPVALKAADLLAAEGISARVIDMHTIKPLDEELVLKAAKETGCIVTSEEHSVIGGLGAAVCEFLSGTCPVPVVRHGVDDQFGRSGTANAVLEYFGLTPEVLAEKAKAAIAMKK